MEMGKAKLEQRMMVLQKLALPLLLLLLVIVVVFLPIAMSTGLVANILAIILCNRGYCNIVIIVGFFYHYSLVVIKIWKITTSYR